MEQYTLILGNLESKCTSTFNSYFVSFSSLLWAWAGEKNETGQKKVEKTYCFPHWKNMERMLMSFRFSFTYPNGSLPFPWKMRLVVKNPHANTEDIRDRIWSPVEKMPGDGNGTPLQHSCLENPMDWGAWWAAVHGVSKSRTQLSDFTFTFHFHALEKEMATHSSVLAWRIPGTGSLVGCHLWGRTE